MNNIFNWELDLSLIKLSFTDDYAKKLLDKFREKYPGNYSFQWICNPGKQYFQLVLAFDTEEEETWWKLKNSSYIIMAP